MALSRGEGRAARPSAACCARRQSAAGDGARVAGSRPPVTPAFPRAEKAIAAEPFRQGCRKISGLLWTIPPASLYFAVAASGGFFTTGRQSALLQAVRAFCRLRGEAQEVGPRPPKNPIDLV